MSIDLNALAAEGKHVFFVFFFFSMRSHNLTCLRAEMLRSAVHFVKPSDYPPHLHPFFFPSHLFYPILSSPKSSVCRHPTRAGLRSSASSWAALDPATSCLWRRAAAPTWLGCRPGTRSWRSRVTMCQRWVPKLSLPSPRLRRTSLPVSEWCPAYSRSYSFSIHCSSNAYVL